MISNIQHNKTLIDTQNLMFDTTLLILIVVNLVQILIFDSFRFTLSVLVDFCLPLQ